jgi:hypothetical protein
MTGYTPSTLDLQLAPSCPQQEEQQSCSARLLTRLQARDGRVVTEWVRTPSSGGSAASTEAGVGLKLNDNMKLPSVDDPEVVYVPGSDGQGYTGIDACLCVAALRAWNKTLRDGSGHAASMPAFLPNTRLGTSVPVRLFRLDLCRLARPRPPPPRATNRSYWATISSLSYVPGLVASTYYRSTTASQSEALAPGQLIGGRPGDSLQAHVLVPGASATVVIPVLATLAPGTYERCPGSAPAGADRDSAGTPASCIPAAGSSTSNATASYSSSGNSSLLSAATRPTIASVSSGPVGTSSNDSTSNISVASAAPVTTIASSGTAGNDSSISVDDVSFDHIRNPSTSSSGGGDDVYIVGSTTATTASAAATGSPTLASAASYAAYPSRSTDAGDVTSNGSTSSGLPSSANNGASSSENIGDISVSTTTTATSTSNLASVDKVGEATRTPFACEDFRTAGRASCAGHKLVLVPGVGETLVPINVPFTSGVATSALPVDSAAVKPCPSCDDEYVHYLGHTPGEPCVPSGRCAPAVVDCAQL